MTTMRTPFLYAGLTSLVVVLAGLLCRQTVRIVAPYDLATCCAVLYYREDFAGTGFFVQTVSTRTNTYLVTAFHTITNMQAKAAGSSFQIRALVKRRDGRGGVELNIPWDTSTPKPQGEPFDLAVTPVDGCLRSNPDTLITPVVLKYRTSATSNPSAREPDPAEQWAFSPNENIPLAIERSMKSPDAPTVPLVKAGKPGFMLFPSRKAHKVAIGDDVFLLAAQNYFEASAQPFAIFLRPGILSFAGIDGSEEDPAQYGNTNTSLVIACPSSKGNSGAPVFLKVATTRFGVFKSVTPHLIGVLTGMLTSAGPIQKHDFSIKDPVGNTVGKVAAEHVLTENASLSVVCPVDHLVRMLIDFETRDR